MHESRSVPKGFLSHMAHNEADVIDQFQRLFPDNHWIERNLVMMPFSGQKDWDIQELLQKIESLNTDRSGGNPVV